MDAISEIVSVFERFRMPLSANDQFETKGRAHMIDKVTAFVEKDLPVKFSMLGYPFKSINERDKVIGKTPDLGESLSLTNFAHFADSIREVYSPGAQFSIISDGYIFSDLMKVDDRVVAQYSEENKGLSSGMPIRWFDINDFYPKELSMQDKREKVMQQFGISPEELERRILFDPNVNYLYRGMMLFMKGDMAIWNYPTGSQLQKHAKIMAREMMFRNEAYSALIRSNFADHIRLSMHQSNNDGTKYSFQLIPSPKAKHSPWHAAILVRKDGSLETMHRKEATEAGHELVYENGKPFYFAEK